MRTWALVGMVLLALSSGCLGGSQEPGEAPAPPGQGLGGPPAPIVDHKQIPLTDPAQVIVGPCLSQVATCQAYPFEVTEPTRMVARLNWTEQGNDLDLLLYADGQEAGASTALPPGNLETIETRLEPGTYRLVVVSRAIVEDTYTLRASFTR